MRDLPEHIRNGFILAKAVRIASIAQPDNIEEFELEESISADDVITSFILKACLFGKDKQKNKFDKCSTAYDVAKMIYKLLQDYLRDKKVDSEYSHETPVFCKNCEAERGCCKKK